MATRRDPTRTGRIVRRFRTDLRKRFRALNKKIRELVVGLDVFGLEKETFLFNVERQAFRFQTDEQKIRSFNRELQRQIDLEILTVDSTKEFVESAYKKGQTRAFIDAKRAKAIEGSEAFGSAQEQFLSQAFNSPERLSKVRLLATRSFEELRGITQAMSQKLNRNLADGLIQGQGPRQIAAEMSRTVAKITKQRALVLARTEIVHAHAEGQLDAFADLGIEEVGAQVEFQTAGDDRVCARCEGLEGEIFSVDEARGIIPVHPNCRCAWVPAVQATQSQKIRRGLRRSRARRRQRAS